MGGAQLRVRLINFQCLLMLAAGPRGIAANGISAQINLIKSFSFNCVVNNLCVLVFVSVCISVWVFVCGNDKLSENVGKLSRSKEFETHLLRS